MSHLRTLAVALAVIALVAGCSVATSDARRIDPGRVPFDLLDPKATPVVPLAPSVAGSALTVCLIDADGAVRPVPIAIEGEASPAAALRAAASVPAEGGFTTTIPEERTVQEVDVARGAATVDLVEDFDERVPGPDQLLYVAQAVCTLTSIPGIGQVSFTRGDQPLAIPTDGGALTSAPVSGDDFADLLSRE